MAPSCDAWSATNDSPGSSQGRRGFDHASEPVVDDDGNELRVTRRYSNDVGEVFQTVEGAEAVYEFAGDELYVRARITSSKEHPNPGEPGETERAWSQPVLGPGAEANQ